MSVACPNRAVNLQMCPCPNQDCERRGICCECVQAHAAASKPNACARLPQGNPAALGLVPLVRQCTANLDRNRAFCPCGAVDCVRRGTCCECVRNHYAPGGGHVACLRPLC